MSFFAGVASGWGEGQGQYNNKMLDFMNQKSQSMAQLYGHLADSVIQNGGDQDIATEFLNRAKGWASANPLMDPKGYKAIIQQEKGGLHDIVDQATQRKIANYHSQNFGGQAPQTPQQSTQEKPATINNSSSSQTSTPYNNPGQNIIPSIPDLMENLSGGQPTTGSLGVPTPMGKMAMGVIPDVIKQRLEMQYKMQLMSSMFNSPNGLDKRSPSGSAEFATWMKANGFNVPVTQWRPIQRALFQDPQGKYYIAPAMQSYRDGSTWVRSGPGQEIESQPLDENPKIETAKDGSTWAITAKGPIKLDGQIPVQTGTSSTTEPTLSGGTTKSDSRIFSGGVSAAPTATNIPPAPGTSNILPPGVKAPHKTHGGPPTTITSTPKPSQAYNTLGNGEFNLEKLQNSHDPIDRAVANFVVHPESFDFVEGRKFKWDQEFQKRGLDQAPIPLKEIKYPDFEKQRSAIVNGMHAAQNIKNILTDTDGALVGLVAGKWVEAMNKIGSAKGISAFIPATGNMDSQDGNFSPNVLFGRDLVNKMAQERPELSPALLKNPDMIASKAADLITTMRLFNFADVRNVIGGTQGISRTYNFLKSSLLNPGMDLPLILGHLSSLDRNMADGLYTLESSRWGQKIPYIREKELMSNLYWDNHIEGMLKAVTAKHPGLSRQDALFILWRNGRITADPGNPSGVNK